MRKVAIALAASALLAAPAAQAADKPSGEERLTKLLEGRVAGEPVSCIPLSATRDVTMIDKTAIVYDAGSVIYVNRTMHPESIDDDYVMVTKIHGGQLCSVDAVELRDRSQFFYAGFVGLDKFVPYRKAAKSE